MHCESEHPLWMIEVPFTRVSMVSRTLFGDAKRSLPTVGASLHNDQHRWASHRKELTSNCILRLQVLPE